MVALADDAMEGRETGTPATTARPGTWPNASPRWAEPAGDDGGWRQAVPLLKGTALAEGARLEVRRGGQATALELRTQFLPGADFNRERSEVEAPAVFVGQAVHAPELGHDDFAGLDLRGRIAVMFGGAPGTFDDTRRAFHSSRREKLRNVVERGAIGAVMVNTADDEARYPVARTAEQFGRRRCACAGPTAGRSAPGRSCRPRRGQCGGGRSAVRRRRHDLRAAVRCRARGRLRGFDLPGTLLLAGRTRPSRRNRRTWWAGSAAATRCWRPSTWSTPRTWTTSASAPKWTATRSTTARSTMPGVAIMLEAARELAQGPAPGRSLLFVALTGEEQGLLGAEWFARHPPVEGTWWPMSTWTCRC